MKAGEVYEEGVHRLNLAWQRAKDLDDPSSLGIPDSIALSASQVMQADNQVGQKYGLPGQLLLKLTIKLSDSRQTKGITDIGQASARSFVKQTIVANSEVTSRLGSSDDPYVSNPMRRDRLGDELLEGQGGDIWQDVFTVLGYADENPDQTENLLTFVLSRVTDWPSETSPEPPPTLQMALSMKGNFGALVESAGVEEDLLLDVLDVLESEQPQVVFTGPPGTGKTHAAQELAKYLVGRNYKVVQFHASYGYEDFIEGLRPVPSGSGGLEFNVKPGVIRRIAADMSDGERFLLVLDEFNRANLPRVLGELLYALERRGEPVDLLYTEAFELPLGLMLIATMNTADRSTHSIDAAMRRRFRFFDFAPSGKVLTDFYQAPIENEVADLVKGFEALNTRLTALLDRHHTIGHTYFLEARGMTNVRLRKTWNRQIFPLLEEYLVDFPDELGSLSFSDFWPSAG